MYRTNRSFVMRRYPIFRALSVLTGLFMLFIGLHFLLAPRAGVEGYGWPLAWVLLFGAGIPCVDAAVVLAQPAASLGLALPHLVAIGLLLGLAWALFTAPAASPRLA